MGVFVSRVSVLVWVSHDANAISLSHCYETESSKCMSMFVDAYMVWGHWCCWPTTYSADMPRPRHTNSKMQTHNWINQLLLMHKRQPLYLLHPAANHTKEISSTSHLPPQSKTPPMGQLSLAMPSIQQYCSQASLITRWRASSWPYLSQLLECPFNGGTLVCHDPGLELCHNRPPGHISFVAF